MSNVTSTSREAYHNHKANNFAGQHRAILNAMRPGLIYSRRQVAQKCHMETSTVSARVFELVATGQVVVVGKVRCPLTGIMVEALKLPTVQVLTEQLELA